MRILLLLSLILILSSSLLHGQDNSQDISVALKESTIMKIYVNEKYFDFPIELIEFNAPNGVILITTKKDSTYRKEQKKRKRKEKQ